MEVHPQTHGTYTTCSRAKVRTNWLVCAVEKEDFSAIRSFTEHFYIVALLLLWWNLHCPRQFIKKKALNKFYSSKGLESMMVKQSRGRRKLWVHIVNLKQEVKGTLHGQRRLRSQGPLPWHTFKTPYFFQTIPPTMETSIQIHDYGAIPI